MQTMVQNYSTILITDEKKRFFSGLSQKMLETSINQLGINYIP